MSRSTGTVSPIYEPLERRSEDHDHHIDANTGPPSIQVTKEAHSATAEEYADRSEKQSGKNGTSDWYIWEGLGVAMSGATLIAMVAVLASYNDQPEPKWKYMSLNSLVSWLSTVSKGCILFSISEALGQMKWTWFVQGSRPIPDLRKFDTASRGFYGAMLLIWRLRARHFAVLSCLAVILALGFDPFAQNLVHYRQKMTIDTSQHALMGNVSTYNNYGFAYATGTLGVDPVLKSNVYNSLLNRDRSRPWAIPQYSCNSANCTWDAVASLETRALCTDVTGHLEKSCEPDTYSSLNVSRCDIRLPKSNTAASFYQGQQSTTDGIFAFHAFYSGPADQALVYTNSTTLSPLQFITPRLANITQLSNRSNDIHLWDSMTNLDTWVATECVIEPIVRSSRPLVRDNDFSDETLAIWNTGTWQDSSGDVTRGSREAVEGWRLDPPWGEEKGMQPGQAFLFGNNALTSMNMFINNILTGYFFHEPIHQGYNDTGNTLGYATADILQALGQGDIVGCGMESANRLTCSMQNIAAAISKTLRDSAYIDAASKAEDAHMTAGDALTSVTYVWVHWQWIALPALVWVMGAVVLAGTIWKTHRARVPKWRNDPLPLLFLYRDEVYGAQASGMSVHSDSDEVDNLRARLYKADGHMVLGS